MQPDRRKTIRNRCLSLIRKATFHGVFQRELEVMLDISKSYCSEVVSSLENGGKIIRNKERGKITRIYVPDYYPGNVAGLVRVGLLRSSEYVPLLSYILEHFGQSGQNVKLRYYNSVFEIMTDFSSHALDLCLAPTTALIFSAIMGSEMKILTGTASGGSGIIQQDNAVNEGILSTETSSMISLALSSQLPDSYPKVVSFDEPANGLRKFLEQKYSKIAIWEPYFSSALKLKGRSVFASYNEMLDSFPCCSLASGISFFSENRDVLEHLTESYLSIDTLKRKDNAYYREALRSVSRVTKFQIQFVERTVGSYDFSSTRIEKQLLSKFGISLSERQAESIFLPGVLV